MTRLLISMAIWTALVTRASAGGAGGIETSRETAVPTPPGAGWALQESSTTDWLQSAAWSGSRFVAVGTLGTILFSSDGSLWNSAYSDMPLDLYDVIWSGGQFIAVGCDTGFLRYCIVMSPDGISWAFASGISNPIEGLYGIVHSDSTFIAVGYGGQILSSRDGDMWEERVAMDSLLGRSLYGVTWSGSEFVAVGEVWDFENQCWNAMVARSTGGLDWSYKDLGLLGLLFDVTWDGNQFIAVGYTGVWGLSTGTILTSPDGVEWTMQRLGAADYLRAVSSHGGNIIAVGDNGTIATSRNGLDWIVRRSGTNMTLSGIAVSERRVVVVGTSGTILASP